MALLRLVVLLIFVAVIIQVTDSSHGKKGKHFKRLKHFKGRKHNKPSKASSKDSKSSKKCVESKGSNEPPKADCGGLPQAPINGHVTGSSYLQDDVVTYTCNTDYILEGKGTSTCQNDKSWTNVNSTICRADCGGLPLAPINGHVTGSSHLQDDVVTYTCNTDYILEGKGTSTCQNDKSWTNVNSTICRAVCGGLPQAPINGHVTGSSYLQDDVVTYTCNTDYVLEGKGTSTCQNDKSWTNVNSTICRADCGGLPLAPINGHVTGSSHLQDDVVTYTCNTDYILEGKGTSTCQNDKSWTNVNSTICRADCKVPPLSPANGGVIGTNYLQGNVVTYTCNSGYAIEGQDTYTCQIDGSWGNVSTTCKADCGPPSSPENGDVTGSRYLQGDVVTYTCDLSYELNGENKTTCQSDRSWDNDNITCECATLPRSPVTGTRNCTREVYKYNGRIIFHFSKCMYLLLASKQTYQLDSHDMYGDVNYCNHVEIEWLIKARDGFKINLHFTALDTEYTAACDYDYVDVFDSHYKVWDNLLGTYCGNTVPTVISSTGQYMLVRFISDESSTFGGFSAFYGEGEQNVVN